MYDAIANEFERLLKEKQLLINKISLLKKGSVSRKIINGKERFYHQYREGGKVISRYISPSLVDVYVKETDERKQCAKTLSDIELQLNKIKRAAEILSNELYNRLVEIERHIIKGKEKSKMLKIERRITTYKLDCEEGFYVDVIDNLKDDNFIDLWLYNIDYGIKELIIGIQKDSNLANNIEDAIIMLLKDYDSIASYKQEYMK